MTQPTYGIGIIADDKTAKGIKSAEKRLGTLPKRVSALARAQDRALTRSAGNFARTMGNVERSTARVFGNRSITAGVTSRLGAIGQAASAAGAGMGEAAASGGLLTTALGGIGVVAGATLGVIAAAGYAAFKLADGWAKGAAAIGRTADIMGVARKEMQEFAAASERMGIDKGVATGSLGGLSQTLNDARYGRNSAALAVLTKLGVPLKTNADGTVNVAAMLPSIADAIARQNSSGRRTAVKALGMSEAMIPVLAQGGKALAADMADAAKTAYIATDDDINRGMRIQRKGAMVGQMVDKGIALAGSATADAAEPGYDLAISTGKAIVGGTNSFGGVVQNVFRPAADKIRQGGRAIERAAERFTGAVNYSGGGAGRLTREGVISEARKGVRLRNKLIAAGFTQAEANALAANSVRESGANYRRGEVGGGSGYGLFQWTNKKRKDDFKRLFGHSIFQSSEDEQIRFLRWETQNSEAGSWTKSHNYGSDPGAIAYGFTKHFERPKFPERDGAERAAVARALDAIPVHVTVEVPHAPPGTRATAKARPNVRSGAPAISRSFPTTYQPVHGG